MIKKVFLCAAVAMLVVGALVAIPENARAADLHVGPGQTYSTIQAAVDDAGPGDTIIVHETSDALPDYEENIYLNTSKHDIIIQVAEGEDVTVQGTVPGTEPPFHVFHVTRSDITIEGFTIIGPSVAPDQWVAGIHLADLADSCDILGNHITRCEWGISVNSDGNQLVGNETDDNAASGIALFSAHNNYLEDNYSHHNHYNGIFLNDSDDNEVIDNTASDNIGIEGDAYDVTYGIQLYDSYRNTLSGNTASGNESDVGGSADGIRLSLSDDNTLSGNTANDNDNRGIRIGASSWNTLRDNTANGNGMHGINLFAESNNNTISGNTANGNDYGFYIYDSSYNDIIGNTANSNAEVGIFLGVDAVPSPEGNTIYLNSFSGNWDRNVTSQYPANTWHTPAPANYTYDGSSHTNYLGNYWSDYYGSDTNGDGVGDTDLPYPTDGDGDRYPLTATPGSYDVSNYTPTAADDTATVDEDSTNNSIDVRSNDSDPDGDTLTITDVTDPNNGGTATTNGSTITYTPVANFAGTETFDYTIDDGNGGTDTATVTVTVENIDTDAIDDNYDVDEDSSANILEVLTNDNDPEGDTLTITEVSEPDNGGTATTDGSTITYAPAANFSGIETFTYTIDDGNGDTDTATVTVTVENIDTDAIDDNYNVDEDSSANVLDVLSNDNDPEGDTLTITEVSEPDNDGTATTDGLMITYTPAANFAGTETFDYTIDDGNGGTSTGTVTVTVNPSNDAPVAVDDAYTVDEGKALNVAAPGVLKNDQDADGDSLSAKLAEGPSHGTLVLNADGSFTYTPNAGFTGEDSFTYLINDGTVDSNVAKVTITVKHVNSPPVPTDDAYTIDEGGTLSVDAPGVLDNDADDDGDPLIAILVKGPSDGILTFNADGSFTYTPNAGFTGEDSFTYRAYDDTDSVVGTVTINVESPAEAASGDSGISPWVWVAVALGILIPAVVVIISIRRRAAA